MKNKLNLSGNWTHHAKAKGERRTRRIDMRLKPETAGKLMFLAKLAGCSATHTVETMIEAEFEKRRHEPIAPALMRALVALGIIQRQKYHAGKDAK